MPETPQAAVWSGPFGRSYTDRNDLTIEELDAMYESRYGVTRSALNARFLDGVDRGARILEVGTNVGTQLGCLRRQGFTRLYGIELQAYAVARARSRLPGVTLIQGSATGLPFRDGSFDLVFTSGVLIHLAPADLATAMREIHRCSRRGILGLEYFAPELTGVPYRGRANLLWKADYAALYRAACPDLELVREERLPYRTEPLEDAMFLLRKRERGCASSP
ncbi:MAG TPA: pseudaminic acid biosynthesis-associated methylase [bacterium]